MKETELAKKVIEWLASDGWDVYQEVQLQCYGRIADIVATLGNLVWVIECKTTLTFAVMAQAHEWQPYANYCSVAVPLTCSRSDDKGRGFARKVLETFGIGLLELRKHDDRICPSISPKLNRRSAIWFHRSLRKEHKTFARAGNFNGSRFSPFQETCRSLLNIVHKCPGITLKDAIDILKEHHYSSDQVAISALNHWLSLGKVRGIHRELDGKKYRLFPNEENI